MFRSRFVITLSILFTVCGAAGAQTVFLSELNGGQETPPNASTASGSGLSYFDPATSIFKYTVSVAGLTPTFSAAHVHTAFPGIAGGILFGLSGVPPTFAGSSMLSAGSVTDLKSSKLYFNVHTTPMFPAGEIRGQITPSLHQFDAVLTGAKENPPTGSGATGLGTFTYDPSTKMITYSVTVSGVSGTDAHIHEGDASTNGPIIFPLAGGPTTWSGTTAALTDTQVAKLRSGLYYTNVHSIANPGGEIRGQITPSFLPYGTGCPGSVGIPTLSGSGIPTPGETVTLTVTGGLPSGGGRLILSLGGAETPVPGACTLLVTFAPIFIQIPMGLDGSGMGSFSSPIPAVTPPLWVYFQYLGFDGAAPNGVYYLSNGLGMQINN